MPKRSERIIVDNEQPALNWSANTLKIIITLVILLIGMALVFFVLNNKPTAVPVEKAENIFTVKASAVNNSSVQIPIELSGVVEATDVRQISANISGSVLDIHPDFEDQGLVTKGQWLIKVDTEQLNPELSQAQAQVTTARAAYQTAVLTAENNNAALKELGIKGTPNPPQVIEARARLNAAQQQLKAVQDKLKRSTMYAPYNSRVLKRIVNPGDLITAGMPIAQTMSSDKVTVRLPIADPEMRLLDKASFTQGAKLPITISDPNSDFQWNGAVTGTEIGNNLNNQFNYLIAEIYEPFRKSDDPADRPELTVGSSVSTQIASKPLENVFKLPLDVVHNGNEVWVYDNGRLKIKPIEIAYRGQSFVYVSEGLQSGDQVISSNINLPVDGMKLKLSQP